MAAGKFTLTGAKEAYFRAAEPPALSVSSSAQGVLRWVTEATTPVGPYKSNPLYPYLESPLCQPSNLSSEKLVSKFASIQLTYSE